MTSEPPSSAKTSDRIIIKPQARHSEKALIETLAWTVSNSSTKILMVYTERQPCGKARGHANCTKRLESFLATYGAVGADTRVHYSFDYPTADDIRFLLDEPELGVEEEDLVEMCKEMCSESSQALIAYDKALSI